MDAVRLALALSLALAALACDGRPAPPAPAGGAADPPALAGGAPDPLEPLRRFEASRRAAADFSRQPSSDRLLGPDPIALRPVDPRGRPAAPGAPALLSPLRGRDALVLLDASLRELSRAPAPASPTGVAVLPSGDVFASGEASPALFRYALRGASIEPAGRIELAGVRGVRDLAAGPEGVLYALDERAGALLTLRLGADGRTGGRMEVERWDEPIGAGPFRVVRLARHLLVACLLDHTLVVLPVGEGGRPLSGGAARIRHDGPIWSFDAIETEDGGLLIAAGGVEDHPLDRTGGSFGYIDSFVFLYRVAAGARPEVTRLAAVNVSEHGVLTPKAIALSAVPGSADVRVIATGYGGDRRAELVFRAPGAGSSTAPEVSTRPLAPGVAAMAALGGGAFAYANPLLDAWLLDAGGEVVKRPVHDDGEDARSGEVRLGEALFFTSLMAPWNRTDGPLSRFTCETCHFEGYVDGRTHHTGRGDVRATTKPLLGLFNNRPHFSRALDPDLTTVADNEFRVAGALSGHDPWFSVSREIAPWLADLGVFDVERADRAELSPEALRRALMSFLMEFSHRTNPAVVGRAGFSALERDGARVFRDRCARCHAPVLRSDDPGSAVPFERWEELVFAPEGAIVWGRAGYEKTGVVPYVHEEGARVPSLRRLYKKRPYFTNGSARTLRDVLERARFAAPGAAAVPGAAAAPGAATAPGAFFHDGAPEGLAALDPAAIDALLAFLDLL
ncbi:hypothetical protein [Sorangium sp. So ce513]|uniref:hypothetical protein n=1 Tax=Sorangium sp. So ce513 TaxID=3133315 RepID=UPI003F5F84C9